MELSTIIKGVVKNKQKKGIIVTEDVLVNLARIKVLDKMYSGNFTTVVIGEGTNIWYGVSKRNPADAYNTERGECLAAARAVHDAMRFLR